MRIYASILIALFIHMSHAKQISPIHYTLSIPEPHTHYVKVEMEIACANKKEVTVSMPVWTPGSYLVREFSKSVERFEATASGKQLPVIKTNKNNYPDCEKRVHLKPTTVHHMLTTSKIVS